MNPSVYTKLKSLISDTLKPAIVGLRDFLNARIDAMRSEYDDALEKLRADLWAHLKDFNNPHRTTMQQLCTFASFPPTANQGKVGDVWFEYLPQTVKDLK